MSQQYDKNKIKNNRLNEKSSQSTVNKRPSPGIYSDTVKKDNISSAVMQGSRLSTGTVQYIVLMLHRSLYPSLLYLSQIQTHDSWIATPNDLSFLEQDNQKGLSRIATMVIVYYVCRRVTLV